MSDFGMTYELPEASQANHLLDPIFFSSQKFTPEGRVMAPFMPALHNKLMQSGAQLSQRYHVMHYVRPNLVICCRAVRKITSEKG